MRLLCALVVMGAAGCKTPCERAIDHVAEVAYADSAKSATTPAAKEALRTDVAPSLSEMMPALRKIARPRIEPRCGDERFLGCVMAASDPFAIARCQDPSPPN